MIYRRAMDLAVLSALTLLTSCAVSSGPEPDESGPDPAEAPQSETPADGLNMQEANVVAVEFESLGDGSYRFDVTLLHDDIGEAPDYADAWQVEDLDGNVLGERRLLHSHGNEPFTRSATINIPARVETVVIRGHDRQHGFGGQAMRVNLNSGQTIPMVDREE